MTSKQRIDSTEEDSFGLLEGTAVNAEIALTSGQTLMYTGLEQVMCGNGAIAKVNGQSNANDTG